MDIDQLIEKLSEIEEMGYIVSKRKSDTGVGYTLEELLGIKENNLQIPDLGKIEVKSQRKGVSNRMTMFTFNTGVWTLDKAELIKEYGYFRKGRQSLSCTVNTKPNNQGLYLTVEEDNLRLYHVDNMLLAEWSREVVIDIFRTKMPAVVVVYADTRRNSDRKEEFWYNEAHFLTKPNEDVFLELINQNVVIVEVRMYLKESGAVRNRGTGFRMSARFLDECFGSRERII
jgi:hypothetical protein